MKIDPRVQRTVALLKRAMCTLMEQSGLESISVTDIAYAAGVNRATFYAHFDDKLSLLEACVRDLFREHVTAAAGRDLLEVISEFLQRCSRPSLQAPVVEAAIQSELYDYLRPRLARDSACTVLSWAAFGVAKRLGGADAATRIALQAEFARLFELGQAA